MTDPGRSGGEGTGLAWWADLRRGEAWGYAHKPAPDDIEGCTPVIILDPVTARDTIARALLHAPRNARRPHTMEGALALADAAIAALASQERGE